jgi:hypothetical protein
LTLSLLPVQQVSANPLFYAGEFLYAVNTNPLGRHVSNALTQARNLHPDWLMVDFDWNVWFPARDTAQNFQSLDTVMRFADEQGIGVSMRILNPPAWVLTGAGPDPASTADLIHFLEERYANSMKAVEVFPGANTKQGWGAAPSPQAYVDLLETVQQKLVQEESRLLLVAGGLIPVSDPDQMTRIGDIAFLEGLYAAGFHSVNAILSLQLLDLAPDIFQVALDVNEPVLLHIDAVQTVMNLNHDAAGPVWVTAVSFENGAVQGSESLLDICTLLRSRLFVGLVSPAALNPVNSAPGMMSLMDEDGSAGTMQQLIASNRSETSAAIAMASKNLQSIRKEEPIHESHPLRFFFTRLFGLSCSRFGSCQQPVFISRSS